MDCGDLHPYFVMDFDHRDPATKVAEVSQLVKNYTPWDRVLDEIAKCDLVCANCHRLRTYKGQHCYKTRLFEQQRTILDKVKSSTPCFDCGERFQPCQMDFDHVNPRVKEANIARLVGGSTETLLTELSKCHLVCANCHRIRESTGQRPENSTHGVSLVQKFKEIEASQRLPVDRRFVPFPHPELLGVTPDKVLAEQIGISKEMVGWYRRKAGIKLDRQGRRTA